MGFEFRQNAVSAVSVSTIQGTKMETNDVLFGPSTDDYRMTKANLCVSSVSAFPTDFPGHVAIVVPDSLGSRSAYKIQSMDAEYATSRGVSRRPDGASVDSDYQKGYIRIDGSEDETGKRLVATVSLIALPTKMHVQTGDIGYTCDIVP